MKKSAPEIHHFFTVSFSPFASSWVDMLGSADQFLVNSCRVLPSVCNGTQRRTALLRTPGAFNPAVVVVTSLIVHHQQMALCTQTSFRAQYDWTTGVPDDGNDWRKFRVVPRSYPLRPLIFYYFSRGGNRRAFRLPGEGGDHFHCTVEPSPGHIRCRLLWSQPALCPKILGTRFTNYGLRMFWSELMVIWQRWFETVPCRVTLNTPFSALCPRILGTRFTNYGLRVSGWCRFFHGLRRFSTVYKGHKRWRKKSRYWWSFFHSWFFTACPLSINFISPQNAENGDPKIRNRDGPGSSSKFRFSVDFPQKPSVRVIPGSSSWGPHFQRFGGIFWGKWE